MNKLMKFLTGRYTALSLAVISGTIAAAGCLIILFNLGVGLYQKPLETVISSQAENMQYWYSAKIFSQMETIADTSGNKKIEKNFDAIRTGLHDYLDTKNLEYGVIHADTLHGIDLSDKKNYIYENFQSAPPDKQSLSICFIEKHCGDPGPVPSLIESLCTSYDFLFQDYVEDPSAKSNYTYWIVSRVKTPLDTTGSDIFIQQKNLLTSLYHYRYAIILLTLFFAMIFLGLTVFCCHQTQKVSNGSSPQVTWKHKLPLLPYSLFSLGVTGLCIAAAIYLLGCLLSGSLPLEFVCMICVVPTAAAILSFILMLVNLSTRVHAGIFWKYTLIHHLIVFIRHVYQIVARYTSLFIRGSILIIAISLCELLISAWLWQNSDGTILIAFWILIKIMELLVLLPILLQMKRLQDGSRKLAGGNLDYKLDTAYMFPELKKHAGYLNQIGDGMSAALADSLKSEHFKTELITNVSHDIKTPLTSLINYVDLLQRENITEEQRMEYLGILERQSTRLKKLIEDLIEASKASTGNLIVNKEPCDIQILLTQAAGEFEEKLQANDLELLIHKPDTPVTIQADNRHLWRIFDNLMNNICKYAQPGTRVYIDIEETDTLRIIFRNTSKYALNRDGTELTERFIRGDASRHTEGNGLGLSIAQSLAESMDGTLTIHTDGDLFKVIVEFPVT